MDRDTTEYLKRQVNQEFERFLNKDPAPVGLPDIPVGRYISDEFYELEQEHVWRKAWLLAAHTDELPEPGSYKLWTSSGTPVLIVRGRDGEIRAFYNTCTHRGGPLVREESGTEKLFVCKYHCWAFSLEGALNHVPDEHEFIAIDKSQRHLKSIRCELFGNWVYICRDPGAQPLLDYLGPLVRELEDFQPENLKLVTRYHFDLNCNWKLTMDAFQEVYHLKHIHPNTVDAIIDHRGASMALLPGGNSRMMVPSKTGEAKFVSMPAQTPLEEGDEFEMVRSGSLSYNMFPNLVTPTGAVEFPYLQFWPTSKSTTRFEVTYFSRGEDTDKNSPYWQEKVAGFNMVLDEDNQNLPWIQRSIESGAIEGIPLSYQERRIYNFHEYLDQVIGVENIPHELKVVPTLGSLIEDGRGNRLHSQKN